METSIPSPITFETSLNWLAEDIGIVYAKGCNGAIHVSTPQAFGGTGKEWSPEHLFISAVTSCYMSTFLFFAKKAKLIIEHLECKAVGQVQLSKGRYRFTQIDVYPRIFLEDNLQFSAIEAVAQKTQERCLISQSINASVLYHTSIEKNRHPAMLAAVTN